MKTTVTYDRRTVKLVRNIPGDTAKTIVGMIEEEFVSLLLNAPQKSGNYVANMAISAGSRLGTKSAGQYFPPDPTEQQIVNRGSTPAIAVAMRNNMNLKANLTHHIKMGSGGWLPSMTQYNRLDYADAVEAYKASGPPLSGVLRDPNKPGAQAVMKFERQLSRRLRSRLVHDSPEAKRLAHSKIL